MICSCDLDEVLPRSEELCRHYFKEYSQYYAKVNPGQTPPLTLHEIIWQCEFAPMFLVVTMTLASASFLQILRQKTSTKDVPGFYRNMIKNTFRFLIQQQSLKKAQEVYTRWKDLGEP